MSATIIQLRMLLRFIYLYVYMSSYRALMTTHGPTKAKATSGRWWHAFDDLCH